jgi:hypothetical protein
MKRRRGCTGIQIVFRTSLTAALFLLMIASGCNGKADSSGRTAIDRRSGTTAGRNAVAPQANADPGIDLQCVMERIQNPPESFHYSYQKISSNPVHQEADITPQSIEGFRLDIYGHPHPLHGVRSDPQDWQTAWSGLMGISGMSSTIAIVNHDSAMKREGDGEQVNGYKTIRYSIDTARFNATERQILEPAMGPGGFEKGEAWVTFEGCPVKLVLDDEMHKKDGSLLEKIHYEEAMVKK